MIKVVLTLAVIVVAVLAQAPAPLANLCVPYYNSTFNNVCFATNYLILNGTDVEAANGGAVFHYDAYLAAATNPNDACRAAIRVLTCQGRIPRCSRRAIYENPSQARCDAVMSACNITTLPGGIPPCIRNTFLSVDGPNTQCIPTVVGTVGASCSVEGLTSQTATAPTTPQYIACPPTSSCNSTLSNGFCTRPNNIGDACTTTCTTPNSLVGSVLQCIEGRCTITGKRHAQPCFTAGECRSNVCTAGACVESAINGNCNTTLQCRDNLWCDARNQTCYNAGGLNEPCGIVQANWSPVPCATGLTCVRSTSNTTGLSTCVRNAEVNARCSVATGAVAYDFPLCNPATLPVGTRASCENEVCLAVPLVSGATLGQVCNSTISCQLSLTCRYQSGSQQGVCSLVTDVDCDSSTQCNSLQLCNCVGGASQTGKCSIDSQNPTVVCADRIATLATCLTSKCATSLTSYFPYDGTSCGAVQCLSEINAYYCCAKNAVGANFVLPANAPADVCLVTTMAPTMSNSTTMSPTTPGGPTTTGPAGTPTPTPSRSGASVITVGIMSFIIAVIALL